jgi:beta-lactamase regulating signal transducer with metallopeptidase domain
VPRLIALAWLAGVTVLLVRWCGGWWVVRRLTRCGTRPARPEWQTALARAAISTGVRRRVRVVESDRVDTPIVLGHWRPVLLVPVPTFEALAGAEAESVLAHELAHVRRADFAANAMQTLVEILFFFHPAARWMSRRAREERELCCDDIAVGATGSRVVYARALTRLETLRCSIGGGRPVALAASGGDTLLRRIERLAEAPGPDARAAAPARAVAGLLAALTLSSLAALGAVLVPPTASALAAGHVDVRYTVRAHDPAGEFTVTFEQGRPTGATVGGVAVGPERLVTRGDSLFLPWGGGSRHFALSLRPDGFSWTPRRPLKGAE